MKAVAFHRCQKGSPLAFLDLELKSGIVLRGCTLHIAAALTAYVGAGGAA
jgi:hypothetical protein